MTALRPALAACSLLFLTAAPALADTIVKTNGSTVDDAEVKTESLTEVEYRVNGKKQTVPSDQVLRITYTAMPQLVDIAQTSAAEGQVFDAIGDLETYVDGFLAGGKRERYEWAPAHAAAELVALYSMVGELDKSIAAAQKFIDNFGEARQLPLVYLAKAEAQFDKGESGKALGTLDDFQAVIQTKGLSRRWTVENDLAKVLFDSSLQGQKRLDALVTVSAKAGSEFPTVRSRADVAQAEALLETKKVADAEKIFQRVVDDPKATPRTLAAAYTGLGDCLFQRAVKAGGTPDPKLMKDALLAFMRVAVVFKDQNRYVPKAMFYAGRVLDLQDTEASKEGAQRLYLAVLREYGDSSWATEARGFRRR